MRSCKTICVRIKASGANLLDTKIRAGNAAHARVELNRLSNFETALQARMAVESRKTGGSD
jgi:hypothetical protein